MAVEEISNKMIESFLNSINTLAPGLNRSFNSLYAPLINALATNNLALLEASFARIKNTLQRTQHNNEHQQALNVFNMFKSSLEKRLPHAFILLYLKIFGFAGLSEVTKTSLLGRMESIGSQLDSIINSRGLINNLDVAMQNLHTQIIADIPDSPNKKLLIKLSEHIAREYVDIKTPSKRLRT